MSLSNNHITNSGSSNSTADKGKQVQLIFSGNNNNNKRTATDYGDDVNNKKIKSSKETTNSSSSSSSGKEEEAAALAEQQHTADSEDLMSIPSNDITEEYVLFTTDVMDYMENGKSSSSSTTSSSAAAAAAAAASGVKPKESTDNKNVAGEIELVVLPEPKVITTTTTTTSTTKTPTPTTTTLFTRNNLQTTIKNRPLIVSTKNRISEVTQTTAKVSIGNTTISVPLLKPLNAGVATSTSTSNTQLNFSKILNVKRGQKLVNQPTIVSLSQLQIKPVTGAAKIVQAKVLNKKMPIQLKHFTTTTAAAGVGSTTVATTTTTTSVNNKEEDESSTDNKSETNDGTTTTTGGEDNNLDNQNTNIMKNLNLLTTLGSNGSTVLTKINTDMQQQQQQQQQQQNKQIRSTVSIIKQNDTMNEQSSSATTTTTTKKLTTNSSNNNNKPTTTLCLNTNSTSLIAIPRNISLMLAKSNANVKTSTTGGNNNNTNVTAHILNSGATGKKLNPPTSFNITAQRRMSQVSTETSQPYKQAVISCVTMMKPMDNNNITTTATTSIRTNNNSGNNLQQQQQQQQQLLQNYKRAKSADDRQDAAIDKEMSLTNNNNNNNNNNSTFSNKRQISNDIITQAKRTCLNEDQNHQQQQQQQQLTIGNKMTAAATTTTINMTITTSSVTTITSSIGGENSMSNNNNNNNKPEEAHNALLKQLLQNTTNTTIVSVAASSNTTVATSATTTTTTSNSRLPTNNTTQTTSSSTTNSGDSYTSSRKVINIRAPSLGLVSSLEAQLARPAIPPVPTPNATQIGTSAGTTTTLTSVNATTTATTTTTSTTKTNLNRLQTTTTTTTSNEQQQIQLQQQLLQQQTLMTTTSTNLPTITATTTTTPIVENDTIKQQQQHIIQQNMPNEQIQQQQQQHQQQQHKSKSNVQLILKETSFISNPNITQQQQQNSQNITTSNNKVNHQLTTTTPTTSKSPPQELDRRSYNITVFSNINHNNSNNNLNKIERTTATTTEQDATKQTLLDALLNNNRSHKMLTVTTTTTKQQQQDQINNDDKQQQKMLIIENNESNKSNIEMMDTTTITQPTTNSALDKNLFNNVQLKVSTTTTTIPAHMNTDGSTPTSTTPTIQPQTPTFMSKGQTTAMDNKQLANHSPSLVHSPTTVDSPSSKDGDQRRKKKREYQKHRRQLINNNKANNSNNNNNSNFGAINNKLNNAQQSNNASNAKKIRPRKLSKADEDYDNFIDNLMSHIRQMHPIQVLEPVLNRHYGVDNMYGTARQLAATIPQQQRQGKEHEHKSMSHNQLIGEYGKARRNHGRSLYESENINENLQESNVRDHGVIGAGGEKRLPSIQNDFYDQEFSPILYKSERQKLLRFIGFIRERNFDALEMIAAQGGENEDKMLQEFPALTPQQNNNNNINKCIGRMSPILPIVQPFSVKIRRFCMPSLDELIQSQSSMETMDTKPSKSSTSNNDQTVFLSMPLLAADNVLAVLRDLANLLHIPAPSMYKIEAPHVLSTQPQHMFKRRCNIETYNSLQQILNGKRKMCRQCGKAIIAQKGYQAEENCLATLQTKLNLEMPASLGNGRAHYCSKQCYVVAQLARKQQNNNENELKSERLSGKVMSGLEQEKSASADHLSKSKKCRFRYYSAKCFNTNTQIRAVSEKEVTDMLFKMDITVAAKYAATNIDGNTVQRQLDDSRQCVFCNQPGDGLPDGPSRLLNFEVDKWVS